MVPPNSQKNKTKIRKTIDFYQIYLYNKHNRNRIGEKE